MQLYFHNFDNLNKKINEKIYINQILKFVIKLQLKTSYNFILEKSNNLHYSLNKSNIVYIQKKKNEIKHYFNYTYSSDLALIKNYWQIFKAYIKKYPHWHN